MPLSEHEQRILDEIERRLAEEDPKFARTTTRATPKGVALARIKRAVAGFVLGMFVLLGGLIAGGSVLLVLGLGAFGIMLLSVLSAARAAKSMSPTPPEGEGAQGSWMDRFEERWRKRFERPNDGS